jgi:Deoxyribonuclease II
MQVSALDENGRPVDWWFLYKVPKLTKSADSQSTVGYEYKTLWSALSKTDLLVAPPGFTVAQARGVIRSTHKEN